LHRHIPNDRHTGQTTCTCSRTKGTLRSVDTKRRHHASSNTTWAPRPQQQPTEGDVTPHPRRQETTSSTASSRMCRRHDTTPPHRHIPEGPHRGQRTCTCSLTVDNKKRHPASSHTAWPPRPQPQPTAGDLNPLQNDKRRHLAPPHSGWSPHGANTYTCSSTKGKLRSVGDKKRQLSSPHTTPLPQQPTMAKMATRDNILPQEPETTS
jgi:hypothetical protein